MKIAIVFIFALAFVALAPMGQAQTCSSLQLGATPTTADCKAYLKLFDIRGIHQRTYTPSQCEADLTAWEKEVTEWSAANKEAHYTLDYPTASLSVEELTRRRIEASSCEGQMKMTYENEARLRKAELDFMGELLSRAEAVIDATHHNEQYLLMSH